VTSLNWLCDVEARRSVKFLSSAPVPVVPRTRCSAASATVVSQCDILNLMRMNIGRRRDQPLSSIALTATRPEPVR
jgi:hypothetical protein